MAITFDEAYVYVYNIHDLCVRINQKILEKKYKEGDERVQKTKNGYKLKEEKGLN